MSLQNFTLLTRPLTNLPVDKIAGRRVLRAFLDWLYDKGMSQLGEEENPIVLHPTITPTLLRIDFSWRGWNLSVSATEDGMYTLTPDQLYEQLFLHANRADGQEPTPEALQELDTLLKPSTRYSGGRTNQRTRDSGLIKNVQYKMTAYFVHD